MKNVFLAAFVSLLSFSAADDGFSKWELYCGDSCDSTTLVLTGDLETNVADTCTSLGATYEYCHFEQVQEYGSYAVNLDSADSCQGTVIYPGDCTASGSWSNYEIYYYF